MRAMRIRHPAGLDHIELGTADRMPPGAGEIRVRICAASLNFRDGLVVNGFFPTKDGLIPLSDGAGEVVEVGREVTEFAVGDAVVSTFHPNWRDGHVERAELDNAPGGPADGYRLRLCDAARSRISPARPTGLTPRRERDADLRRRDRVARARHRRPGQARRDRAGAGHRRRLAVRAAVRQGGGRDGDRHLVERREAGAG